MTKRRQHDDPLDRLLTGPEPAVHAPVAAAVQRLRDDLAEPPSSAATARHLAMLTEAAAEAAHLQPAPPVLGARMRWAIRARRVLGLTVVKIGLSVGVAAAATGLATSGNLPAPVQRTVVDIADRIGFDLPAPAHDGAEAVEPAVDVPADDHAHVTGDGAPPAGADGADAPPAEAPPAEVPPADDAAVDDVPANDGDPGAEPPVDDKPAEPPIEPPAGPGEAPPHDRQPPAEGDDRAHPPAGENGQRGDA